MMKQRGNVDSNKKPWHLRAMEYMAYGVVSIVPLYVGMQHWFPYNAPKAIIIIFFTCLMLALYSFAILTNKKDYDVISVTPLSISLFAFLLILTISSIFGIDRHNSFFGVWSQSTSVLLIYFLAAFCLLLGILVRKNTEFAKEIIATSFFTSVVIAFFSYFGESLFELSGVGSTLGNNSFAGAYMLFAPCFGVALFILLQKRWQKVLIVLGELIILFCPLFFNTQVFLGGVSVSSIINNPFVLLGAANGATIGLAVGLLIIGGMVLMRNQIKKVRIAGIVLIFLVLLSTMTTAIIFSDANSKLSKFYIEQKGGDRFIFWDIAKQGFKDNPVLGNGLNNYIYTFHNKLDTDFFKQHLLWTNQPHNVFWEYLSTIGILGLLGYLAIFIIIFIQPFIQTNANSEYHILKIVFAGAVFGYFVQNLFVFDTVVSLTALFTVIGVSIGIESKEWKLNLVQSNIIRKFFGSLVLLASIFSIIYFAILPWKESKAWLSASKSGSINTDLSDLDRLQNISPFGGVADNAYFVDRFFSKNNANIVDHIKKTKSSEILVNAVNFLEEDLSKQPRNLRAHMVAAKILTMQFVLDQKSNNDLWDRAHTHIESAAIISPNNPEVYFFEAELYILKGEYDTAQEIVEKWLLLAPTYEQGYAVADELLKVLPNKSLENYVKMMKKQLWP